MKTKKLINLCYERLSIQFLIFLKDKVKKFFAIIFYDFFKEIKKSHFFFK